MSARAPTFGLRINGRRPRRYLILYYRREQRRIFTSTRTEKKLNLKITRFLLWLAVVAPRLLAVASRSRGTCLAPPLLFRLARTGADRCLTSPFHSAYERR